jgi:hypothetical protein
MNPFAQISEQTERAWRQENYSPAAFPALATRILSEFQYKLDLKGLEAALATWLVQGPVPDQVNLHNTFGQPPITVFNNGIFLVEVYIWLTADTSLHSHGFRGAFRLLHGQSRHEIFEAKIIKEYAPDVVLTELGPPRVETLKPGDVRTILPGIELTHRVIHQGAPTVSLCLKTINETELFQWNYFDNGLAIRRRHVPQSLVKSIYYFQYLCGRDESAAANFLFAILANLDLSMQMNLFEEIGMGSIDLTEDTAEFIMETIATRNGESEWFQLYDEATLVEKPE